jgi:membrane fusion protein (multidrug efflux system)
MKKQAVIGVLGAMALGVGLYALVNRGQQTTDAATIEAYVVPIASKVSGYVDAIKVTDNQHVKAGDVLLEVNAGDYIALRDKAKSDYDMAIAKLAAAGHQYDSTKISAPSSLESAQSQVVAAQAEWVRAKKDLERLRQMNESARSKQALDLAVAAEKSTHSALLDAQARLRTAQTAPSTIAAAEAGVLELKAAVDGAKASLALAEINVEATKIRAPFDGMVTHRTAEQGAFVQSGQALMTVVSDEKWVVANYKENQLQKMRVGQPVKIEVDAYPSLELKGKVDSIQAGTGSRFSAFPPENATGNFVKVVQRVPVKIVLDAVPEKDVMLGAGMSVVPTVDTLAKADKP